MKKAVLTLIAGTLLCLSAAAWGGLGHKTVVAIAERHLTEKTKANIARYFDYDLKDDATWMDHHRFDEPIAYTTAWHVYNVDENHNYDPNPRLAKGDCLHGIGVACYNLKKHKELSDSAVVMNVRMLIHFVGDMHCPVHSYLPGPRNFWKCNLEGHGNNTFHHFYDDMPKYLWPTLSPDELAAQLDNCKPGARRKIASGTLFDWAKACGDRNAYIYEINPPLTVDLAPDTVERSRELVSLQLRDAGYRLARLMNEFFGK